MWILFVTFKSPQPVQEVLDKFNISKDTFRQVKGLVQKFYISENSSGQAGAVYVFDTLENLEAFQSSALASGLGNLFNLSEPPSMRTLKVTHLLYEGEKHLAPESH